MSAKNLRTVRWLMWLLVAVNLLQACPQSPDRELEEARIALEESREAAAQWSEESNKGLMLSSICDSQLEIGDIEGALRTAATATVLEMDLFLKVAVAQAKAGDRGSAETTFKKAVAIVGTSGYDLIGATTLRRIAAAKVTVGDTPGAVVIADLLKDDSARDSVLRAIVEVQAEENRFAEALGTAAGIKDSGQRAYAFRVIAIAQAQQGGTAAALNTVGKIERGSFKAEALTEIALAHVKANDRSSATGTFQQALDTR